PQWICWRYLWRTSGDGSGRWTKVPVKPFAVAAGESDNASVTDPATWRGFAEALTWYRATQLDGIGFVFTEGDPFVGIDLDDARGGTTGEVKPWASTIISRLNSYTEDSPSRTGLKVFARGSKSGGKCKRKYADGEIEIYTSGRYFAVTGAS